MLTDECGSCLGSFVGALHLPAALIANGRIQIANDIFLSFMDMSADVIFGQVPAMIFPGFGLEGLIPHSIQEKRAHEIEREMVIGTRKALLSIQIIPVSNSAAVLTITDLAPMRQGQLAFLRQLRRKETDHFWIVDENYIVTFSSVDEPSRTFGIGIGDSILSGQTDASREGALKSFQLARLEPGKVVEFALLFLEQPHPVHVGGMFLHDPVRHGRYFLAVSGEARRGDGAIDRLCEAYGAVNDAELARIIGKTKSAISIARRKGLNPAWAYEALKATGISGDWLMTGMGNKIFRE